MGCLVQIWEQLTVVSTCFVEATILVEIYCFWVLFLHQNPRHYFVWDFGSILTLVLKNSQQEIGLSNIVYMETFFGEVSVGRTFDIAII